jgi:hypothetical protein
MQIQKISAVLGGCLALPAASGQGAVPALAWQSGRINMPMPGTAMPAANTADFETRLAPAK